MIEKATFLKYHRYSYDLCFSHMYYKNSHLREFIYIRLKPEIFIEVIV